MNVIGRGGFGSKEFVSGQDELSKVGLTWFQAVDSDSSTGRFHFGFNLFVAITTVYNNVIGRGKRERDGGGQLRKKEESMVVDSYRQAAGRAFLNANNKIFNLPVTTPNFRSLLMKSLGSKTNLWSP